MSDDKNDAPKEVNPFDPTAPARVEFKRPPLADDGMCNCPLCGGKGWIYTSSWVGPDGGGWGNPGGCPNCRGSKRVADPRTYIAYNGLLDAGRASAILESSTSRSRDVS